jgi:hypothetical protein
MRAWFINESQPLLFAQLPANALLLLVQRHGPIQVAAGRQNQRLVAKRSL